MKETVDVLAIGAHPDDVELGCGGTLAKLVAAGRRVGIVHLTKGEMGTRGTPEERAIEAERAAEVLGAATLDQLDCGDGGLRHTSAEEDALIGVLRRRRPEIVLGPTSSDRHPDHGRAYRLVKDASFYAGLARRGEGEPHRPAAVFSYMQNDLFSPSFLIDISATIEVKEAALAAYESQLHQPGKEPPAGPVTKISTPEFRRATLGRAAHFGLLLGVAYAEPFWSPGPLAVDDLMSVCPGGLR